MDPRDTDAANLGPAQALLGYLNFSTGKPEARFQKQLNEAYAHFAVQAQGKPWEALHEWLHRQLAALRSGGATAFHDAGQVEAVLALVFTEVLPAYRQFHADLLAHQSEADLFQPFFLARVFEAVLAQAGPWQERDRIVVGAIQQLNDFVGYRPVAVLETRPRGEPYDHEKVRPIPLYIRGAGVAWGRYQELVARALDLLGETDPEILRSAQFELQALDELALDPRAYDQGHPVNRRPNYLFGEWDPYQIDQQGTYRRFVVRQITLDALLDRVEGPGGLPRGELLREAAAVLAGTILMAAAISGSGPAAHDSTTSLATLMPPVARFREAFYAQLLEKLGDSSHGKRLREEAAVTRQPFGAARQHLNQYLARHRAAQLQQRYLALLFAEMGYPEASRREAGRIPATSVRLLSEVLSRLTNAQMLVEDAEASGALTALHEAARFLPEVEGLLRRGIACGALADPWNILGFQALFPLSAAREDAIRDSRIDELLHVIAYHLSVSAQLLSEAAALGEKTLVKSLKGELRRFASWWDRFASADVSDVRRVQGSEAAASAEHVATALAHWHERGEATADLAFWRAHLDGFRSSKAFALVVEALLRKQDYRAALALLMNWLSQAEQAPLEDGEHSFLVLAIRWMLGWTGADAAGTPKRDSAETWGLVVRFFDYLEANADDYWQAPELEVGAREQGTEPQDRGLFSAAYQDVTYRDTTSGDDEEGMVADGGPVEEFDLEAEGERLERRLRFLATVARLWLIASRRSQDFAPAAQRHDVLAAWLNQARQNQRRLLTLLGAIHGHPLVEPSGSYDSLVEYDRRRVLKEQLVYAVIGTCLETALAVGTLQAIIGGTAAPVLAGPEARPTWEPVGLELERALGRGDLSAVRAILPAFIEHFRDEPLVFTALANGGDPRQILRVRLAQTILRALTISLPRLGLLRETYHLVKTARAMEQAQPAPGRGVTEFNHLFQAAFQAVVESVVDSAATWEAGPAAATELVQALERLTGPFFTLWVEHGQSLQLSALETVRGEAEWQALRTFVQRYGADLFQARFMTLANLRGILHRGVGPYLDYLRDNPDPLQPVRLLEDLDDKISREQAERFLQLVIQAVVENYEEYKDYKTTATQSDYGDNLYLLLDFLRLKASYERHAWNFRPLALAHEVLARKEQTAAALHWEEAFARIAQDFAAMQLEGLERLEREHGIRLRTVADRVQERFVKPLALDRLCALIEPAMQEARRPGAQPAFDRLQAALRRQGEVPTGVGLDVPHWLRRLEQEVRRVRATQSHLAQLAEGLFHLPAHKISFADLQKQIEDWERPLEGP